jgi:hypothetical protein
MMKRLLFLLLLAGTTLHAQDVGTRNLLYNYDVDSLTLTYCTLNGADGGASTAPVSGVGTVTAAASATIEASTTTSFSSVLAKDVVVIAPDNGVPTPYVVSSVTDGDTIVIDTAITVTARGWQWYKTVCGTAATSGWFNVSSYSDKSISIEYNQGDLDNLSIRYECKGGYVGASPVIVYPGESDGCGGGTLASGLCDFPTAGITARLTLAFYEPWVSCRVGFKAKATDTTDAGAAIEQLTIGFTGARKH